MQHSSTVAAVLAALSLSACVVAPYAPYGAEYGAPVVTDVAPPAPYVEAIPAIPYPGAIWIGGYWGWSGHRHQWVGGRWERPRPGYGWNPYRWEQRGNRWQFHQGGWSRR